jgi:hypothetical protein
MDIISLFVNNGKCGQAKFLYTAGHSQHRFLIHQVREGAS